MQAEKNAFREALGRFVMVFAIIFVFSLMIDRRLWWKTGKFLGSVLTPLFGFGGAAPAWTIFCASLLTVALTTAIRSAGMDWVKTAKHQRQFLAFQKEYRKALLENNLHKLKKLNQLRPELMRKHSEVMLAQYKFMPYTMLIVIPIFAWLSIFVHGLEEPLVALPWCARWNLLDKPYFFSNWILFYMLLSIPIGQLVHNVAKVLKYRKKLQTYDSHD
jgi:uncharacterized membrane protein (DUF106 family)